MKCVYRFSNFFYIIQCNHKYNINSMYLYYTFSIKIDYKVKKKILNIENDNYENKL